MKCLQAYRYELRPNDKQRTLLAKAAGVARFAYNWGLAQRITPFESRQGTERFTSAIEQHRKLNRLKPTNEKPIISYREFLQTERWTMILARCMTNSAVISMLSARVGLGVNLVFFQCPSSS